MPKKTPLGFNIFAYGESVVADHPDPVKRQAPDDTLNHNAELTDQLIRSLMDRIQVLEDTLGVSG
ncbi:hypothetical protein [Deinococcus kurensis]|uniref:hypothetical protein n=1 Tax=Deinococcus kurensis TaxID=2662757 RepID=UPI0012D30F5D|nr:hypothetical protein [Deinococcus kurensis]